jgi:hypothetical protein
MFRKSKYLLILIPPLLLIYGSQYLLNGDLIGIIFDFIG